MSDLRFRLDATIHGLFLEQALKAPDAPALITDSEQLNFRELLARSRRLAHFLVRQGVAIEEPVGVCLERSADLPAALLAVLFAGGCYLPLDPKYPGERIGFMLDDAQARLVITRRGFEPLFASRQDQRPLRLIYLEEIAAELGEELDDAERTFPEALAYLIYTSGSTGRPKGVSIRHRNTTAFFGWAPSVYTPEEMRGVFAGTSVCFDISIFEIFYTLVSGGTVILGRDALHLPSHPARDQVTLIDTVPSAITELVRLKGIPKNVITVNLAGEPLKRALTDEVYATAPWVQKIYNLYGPSEDTTFSSWALIRRESREEPTIGTLLDGSEGYLLDPAGVPVPDGEVGELFIGGLGISRGYLGRPRQTAERFLPDPFSGREGDRIYKTGDRVRRRPDGLLEYLGRFDFQVKIRGFRIELGEIEAALARHPAVEMPLALVREDVPGDPRIVAYFQLKSEAAAPSAGDLRAHLADFLPTFMVPSAFVALPKMPLNPNGKIDRAVLQSMPPPALAPGQGTAAAGRAGSPRTPLEEQLLALLGKLLQAPAMGIHDSFFELGGHSLLAARAAGQIERQLGLRCPQQQIFETPTVAALAAALEAAGEEVPEPIPHRERGDGPLPVSASQLGLFYVWLLAKEAPTYNIAVAARLLGRLDVAALSRALDRLVERHSALRCRFALDDGLPVAVLEPPFGLLPTITDLRAQAEPDAAARELAAAEAARPFDLLGERLVRARLLRTGEEEHVLLLVQHHVISDGISLEIFFRELGELFAAELEDREPRLEPLPITFFDFAAWQAERAEREIGPRLDRWRRRLAGHRETVVPADRPRPARSARRGALLSLPVPAAAAAAVAALAKSRETTFFLAAAAGFYAYLAQRTGSRDLTLGTMRSGRNRPELEGLIGYFISLLPVRVQLPAEPSFLEVMDLVRAAQLDAWSDEELPFHRLTAELAPDRQLSRNPLIDATFQERRAYFGPGLLPGLSTEQLPLHTGTSKFDLEISLVLYGEEHRIEAEYDSELYEQASLESFFAGWLDFLAAAAADPGAGLAALAAPASPAPAASAPAVPEPAGAEPDGTLEQQLHDLWCALLAVPEIDRDAHFFSIGGHSLLAARMIFRIGERLGIELPLEAVYEAPTIALLAARAREARAAAAALAPAAEAAAPQTPVLSFGEERLFFAHLVDPKAATYNLPLAVEIGGDLDVPALERALAEIARRHEILRTTFAPTQGGVLPQVGPEDFRLGELPEAAAAGGGEDALQALVDADARLPFDLRRGPVWRARLGKLDESRHLLLVTFHHIAFDGWSIDLFFAELAALYGAFSLGQPSPLDQLPLQVRDAAAWQRSREAELAGRAQRRAAQLTGLGRAELPADFPRPELFDSRGELTHEEMAPGQIERLRAFAADQGASLFEAALAAFFAWLAQQTGEHDVAVGIPSAGRDRAATEKLIGFFVNTVVVRLDLGGDPDFLEILARTRQALFAARQEEPPFEKLVEALNPARDPSRPALVSHFFQVFESNLDLELPGLTCRMLEPWSGTAKFDTDWAILERGGRHVAEIECSAGLFKRDTAQAFLRSFLQLAGRAADAPRTRLSALGREEPVPAEPLAEPPETAPAAGAPSEPKAALKPLRRDGLERRLSGLWSELLQTPHVGLDDNFFDLGGHSLLLPRLLIELEPTWPQLAVLDFFRFPTVRTLAGHLRTLEPAEPPAPEPPAPAPEPPAAEPTAAPAAVPQPPVPQPAVPLPEGAIAIVGLSGRFPGAPDVESFWRLIVSGGEALRAYGEDELLAAGVPAELLRDPHFVRAGAEVEGIELFDPAFFGYSHREAELIDPQQRVFLECAWEALERSGHRPGGPIGVFAGAGQSGYLLRNLVSRPDLAPDLTDLPTATATDKDYLATRVAYKLDLRGPAVTLQTACSTSLVAVHFACRSLLDGDCDLALAGGVTLQIPQRSGYQHLPGGILSPDGHCRPFDRDAAGMVATSGAGVVVLRRLADALRDGDQIWALIRGSAVNNDGADKIGFTAPSSTGQREVIAKAFARAGFEPASVGYVECHGTATGLGDAIEVEALRAVYHDAGAPASIAIGSLKSQVGHMDAAAGVGGLIRAALAVHHGVLPPTLHFREANPALGLGASPFHVASGAAPWPAGKSPRRAGVSSFGIGGTNAHLLLEAAPPIAEPAAGQPREQQLVLLSAKTPAALERQRGRLADFLDGQHLDRRPLAELADAAFTLHRGRARFSHRLALVAADGEEAASLLRGNGDSRRLAQGEPAARPVFFLFPGQGSQHPGMAAETYRSEPVFRRELDACCAVLADHLGLDLLPLILAQGGDAAAAAARLQATELAQPALFAVEWSLAALWRSWGIEPAGLLGHSIGEYVAAALAGVFARDAALALVAERGRLVASLPPGAMLALTLTESELAPLLPSGLSLATANGPRDLVVSGSHAEIESFAATLAGRGIEGRRLHTSHAFHSAAMEPAVGRLAAEVARASPRAPAIPYLANATGDWVTSQAATDPQAWGRHLRQTVRFGAAVERLFENEDAILLEVGPSRALSSLARRHDRRGRLAERQIVPSLPHARQEGGDQASLLMAAGQLWTLGAEVNEEAFFAGRERRRLVLPTYSFERRRCFIDEASARRPAAENAPSAATIAAAPPQAASQPAPVGPPPAISQPPASSGSDSLGAVLAIWRELLGGEIEPGSDFFDLGGHSLLALQMANRLRQTFALELTIQDILVGRGHTPQLQAALIGSPPAPPPLEPPSSESQAGDFEALLAWVGRRSEEKNDNAHNAAAAGAARTGSR